MSLNGTGSFDDQTPGSGLGYDWTLVSRPPGSASTLQNGSTSTPAFVADVAGTYTVRLIVTDGQGLASPPDEVAVIAFDDFAPAHALPDGFGRSGCGIGATCGYAFEVGAEIIVSELGVTYAAASNQSQPADVGLWDDATGELLATATFSDASDGAPVAEYRYADIAPVILFPGIRYVMGTMFGGPFAPDSPGETPVGFVGATEVNDRIIPIEGRTVLSPDGLAQPTDPQAGPQPGVEVLLLGANFRFGVESSNAAPVAVAGDDRVVQVGDTVQLNGSGSFDDRTPASTLAYDWTLVSRPPGSAATFQDGSTSTPAFVTDVAGTYSLRLVVTDGQGLVSAPDEVVVTAFDGFSPAHALPLDFGRSSCSNGGTCGYAFEVGSEIVVSELGVTYAAAFNLTQTAEVGLWDDVTGELLASATFSDATEGALFADYRYADIGPVTLFPGMRYVMGILFGGPSPSIGETPVGFVGLTEVADPIIPIEGRFTVGVDALNRPTDTVVGPQPGVEILFLGANFRFGVESVNAPPTAAAGGDQTVRRGAEVALDGTGSFDDATPPELLTFDWRFTSRPPGSTAALQDPTSARPSFVADARGTFIVQLVVSDAQGATSAPDEVVITSNGAPVAEAGRDQFVLVGTVATLDGADSFDFEGDPLTYAWRLAAAPEGSGAALGPTNAPATSFVADVAGVYQAELVVSDPLGPSAPNVVSVTAVPLAPPKRNFLDFESSATGRPFLVDSVSRTTIAGDEYAALGVTLTDGDDELSVVRIVPGNAPLEGFHLRRSETGPAPSAQIEIDLVDGSREVAFDFATTSGQLEVTAFDTDGNTLLSESYLGEQDVDLTPICQGPICQPAFFGGRLGQVVVNAGGTSIHRIRVVAPALDPLPPSVVQTQRLVLDNLRYEPPLPDSGFIGRGVTLEPGVVIGENVLVLAK